MGTDLGIYESAFRGAVLFRHSTVPVNGGQARFCDIALPRRYTAPS